MLEIVFACWSYAGDMLEMLFQNEVGSYRFGVEYEVVHNNQDNEFMGTKYSYFYPWSHFVPMVYLQSLLSLCIHFMANKRVPFYLLYDRCRGCYANGRRYTPTLCEDCKVRTIVIKK